MKRLQWIGCAAALLAAAQGAQAQKTQRVSETSGGGQALGESSQAAISADGRFVAFVSDASNLVANDTNGDFDVFVKDRATGLVECVSVSPITGMTGNGLSNNPSISEDGRYVAFASQASDFIPFDVNGQSDIFVFDRELGTLTLESESLLGGSVNGLSRAPSISDDGRYVAYESQGTNIALLDGNGTRDIFVRDRVTGSTSRISNTALGHSGNGASVSPVISGDGQFVAYVSSASDLAFGDINGDADAFVTERSTGTTELVSISIAGLQLGGPTYNVSISDDGRYVAFETDGPVSAADLNGTSDILVRDRLAATSWLASFAILGEPTSGIQAAISGDGAYVAFASSSSTIVGGDANGGFDVFRVPVGGALGSIDRVSVQADGSEAQLGSTSPVLSRDGSQIAFDSFASDLVPGDLGFQDVFVRTEGPVFPKLYCEGKTNSLGCIPFLSFSGVPSVSSPEPFMVRGNEFLPDENGLLLYGTSGRLNLNFHGGKLCVKTPITRWLPAKGATGIAAGSCTGVLQRNFNKRIQSGVDPALTAGARVNAQWLQRDPADPAGFGDALSNGLEFQIGS